MKRMIAAVGIVLGCAGATCAAEGKFGYLDTQRVVQGSDAGKTARAQLQEKLKKYQEQVNQKESELQGLKGELEKQGLALSESKRASKEKDYQQKLKDLQRFTKDAEEDLQAREGELTKKILESLDKIVREYGKRHNFTMIFDKRNSGLLYASQAADVTEDVLTQLNKQ